MTGNILAAGEEHNILLPAMPDLVWGTIAFVIVAFVMYKLAWPTFVKILDERRTQIEDGLTAAAKAKKDMARDRENLAEEVNEAYREAALIRNQAQINASEIVDQAKKDAARDAARISQTARQQIQADTAAAKRSLRSDVGALAIELAERIVGAQTLDPKVSSDVVDRFLDELEEQNVAPVALQAEEG